MDEDSALGTTTSSPEAKMPTIVVTKFQQKVYALLKQVPRGRVTTSGALARALHTSARAVGNALRNNPFAPHVPCHRCVGSTGFITGFNGESVRRKGFRKSALGQVWCRARQSKPRGSKVSLAEPAGTKLSLKIRILGEQGVLVDGNGVVMNQNKVLFDGPWDVGVLKALTQS